MKEIQLKDVCFDSTENLNQYFEQNFEKLAKFLLRTQGKLKMKKSKIKNF